MIPESARYLGSALDYIVQSWNGPITIQRACSEVAGFYVLNEKIPIFIKYSTKRHSPWPFTFHRNHQLQQQSLYESLGECLMVFVCGRDGIAALTHNDFRNILDQRFEDQESVTIRRGHAKMYQIRGRDGKLGRRVGRNSLAEILDTMKNRLVEES